MIQKDKMFTRIINNGAMDRGISNTIPIYETPEEANRDKLGHENIISVLIDPNEVVEWDGVLYYEDKIPAEDMGNRTKRRTKWY